MVTEWRSAFPIGFYVCDTVDLLYKEDQPNEKEVLHKEEGLSRRRLDADDRRRVANELSKHPHPQEGQGEDNVLYNQWQNCFSCSECGSCVSIGDKMLSVFRRWLPSGFHAKMSSPIKTIPEARYQSGRGNCVRCRVYLTAHSDGRTTTAALTGADLLLSIACSPLS